MIKFLVTEFILTDQEVYGRVPKRYSSEHRMFEFQIHFAMFFSPSILLFLTIIELL